MLNDPKLLNCQIMCDHHNKYDCKCDFREATKTAAQVQQWLVGAGALFSATEGSVPSLKNYASHNLLALKTRHASVSDSERGVSETVRYYEGHCMKSTIASHSVLKIKLSRRNTFKDHVNKDNIPFKRRITLFVILAASFLELRHDNFKILRDFCNICW